MTIPKRPLALLFEITEEAGFSITYEYDDLAFGSHNAFIFRFTDIPEKIELFFNQDLETDAKRDLTSKFKNAAKPKGITIIQKGSYSLTQAEGENINIEFLEN